MNVQNWSLGSKSGAMVRAQASHQCGLFVVGCLPCSEKFLSGYFGFPLSLKTNTSKFQFNLEHTDTFQQVLMN